MNNYLEDIKKFLDSDTTEAKISKVVLGVIAVTGLVGFPLLAASLGSAIRVFSQFKKSKKYSPSQIKSAMSNLKQHKLIEYVSDKNGTTNILLTTKGKTKLKSFTLDLIKINKQKIWDKKWRLVMFDLAVRYSRARDSLRFKLKQLGFIQFQKSVWLYPYPCTDEILFVTNYYKVDMFIEIIEATNILREEKFLKAFRLKN